MITDPEVSVIMPVYNATAFLERALASICAQTVPAWELLAVDDASRDDSFAQLQQIAAVEPRLLPLRRSINGGPAAARNNALRLARGVTIAYLDSDDEFYPDYLERILANRSCGDVLVFAYDLLEERLGHPDCGSTRTYDPRQGAQHLLTENIVVPLGVAHRKDLLDRVGLFDERLRFEEDWDLWKRFARAGAQFAFVPAKSGRYHIRTDSLARQRVQPSVEDLPGPPPWRREVLGRLGVRGLHCGCGPCWFPLPWLNTDQVPPQGVASPGVAGPLFRLPGPTWYLQHDASRPFPLGDGSLEWVYAEHFLEHLSPLDGIGWLREVRRLLQPGGLVRLSTPDLGKFLEGYRDSQGQFFARQAGRLRSLGVDPVPPRRSWMVNQIFYGWGHRWLYDGEEVVAAALAAGFPAEAVRRTGFREGAIPAVAALDQPERAEESLYVELTV
jgi:predicted SAM-dependent methyltransferase